MDEKTQSSSESTETSKGAPPVQVPEQLGTLPEQPATQEQLAKVKQEMNAFERSTLRWTRANFGVLGVTGLFICLQWYEMRSGSGDTAKLAQAAVDQATALKLQTQRMETLAGASTIQAGASFDAANAAKSAADTAIQSLRRNTEAFKLDEQARIKLAIGDHGWKMPLPGSPLVATYHYSNIGKTQAEVIGIDKHVAVIPFQKNVDALTFPPSLPDPNPSETILVTSDERIISAIDYSFPSLLRSEVQNGTRLIVSWGCIEYRDIFSEVHWADFCNVLQAPPNDTLFATCAYRCQRKPKTN